MAQEQLEADLHDYLEKESNLRRDDRKAFLLAIFAKHFAISTLTHIINENDLRMVISDAKGNYANKTLPMFVTKKQIMNNDINHVLIMEAFVNYLNRMDLLKKNVHMDYTTQR